MAYQKRLKKEYEELSKRPPEGITLDPSTLQDNIDACEPWTIITRFDQNSGQSLWSSYSSLEGATKLKFAPFCSS